MGFFGKVIQGTFDVATMPLDVMKDIATLGGALTDEDEPYTVQKAKKLKLKADELYDSLDD